MVIMKTIAKNANDFQSIRTMDNGNCIYVDKTDYFHRLVTAPGENLFFVARPRRFGSFSIFSVRTSCWSLTTTAST